MKSKRICMIMKNKSLITSMMSTSIRASNLPKPFKEIREKRIFPSRLSRSMEDFRDRRFQELALKEALELLFRLK